MSKWPFVSVVIVNYNGKKFIKECVDSVLKSNYPNFEVVVIDNASTDGSFEYLKKHYESNKRNNKNVTIIRSEIELYFAGGSNLGAKKAKGEKLVFLNSDTTVDKNWLKELISFGKNHSQYLIQPKILSYWNKNIIDNVGGNYSFFGFGTGKGRREKDKGQHDKNAQVDYANGTCFLIDKKYFNKLGRFDEWYRFHYEDVDLNLRAQKTGGQSWCCPKSIIYHKGSLTIKAHMADETLLFYVRKNRLRTVIKNFSGGQRLLKASGLTTSYLLLILQSLLAFKPKGALLTAKAILANFNQ